MKIKVTRSQLQYLEQVMIQFRNSPKTVDQALDKWRAVKDMMITQEMEDQFK